MAQAIGQECTMSVGGLHVAALLRSCSPSFQYSGQPKLSSGPQVSGVDQTLIGYSPSTGARSGFTINFQVPYGGAKAFLDQCLATAGSTVVLGFGGAGSVSVATCIAELLEVTGSEGGDIEGRATFQSTAVPVPGAGAPSTVSLDFFRFLDVTSITALGGTYTDVSSFSWSVQRLLAAYRGNVPTGIPKYLRIARTECLFTATYLKHDDSEGTQQVTAPPVPVHDVSVLLTRVPLYGDGAESLTLTCNAAYEDAYPQTTGDFETFVTESASYKSTTGVYTTA